MYEITTSLNRTIIDTIKVPKPKKRSIFAIVPTPENILAFFIYELCNEILFNIVTIGELRESYYGSMTKIANSKGISIHVNVSDPDPTLAVPSHDRILNFPRQEQ